MKDVERGWLVRIAAACSTVAEQPVVKLVGGDDASALPFKVTPVAAFDAPWAAALAPGTQTLFVTEKKGTMKFIDLPSGRQGTPQRSRSRRTGSQSFRPNWITAQKTGE